MQCDSWTTGDVRGTWFSCKNNWASGQSAARVTVTWDGVQHLGIATWGLYLLLFFW